MEKEIKQIEQDAHSKEEVLQTGKEGLSTTDEILRRAIRLGDAMVEHFEPDPTLGNLWDKKVVPGIRQRLDNGTNEKMDRLVARVDEIKTNAKVKVWDLAKRAVPFGLEVGSALEKAVDKIEYLREYDKNNNPESANSNGLAQILGRLNGAVGQRNSAREEAKIFAEESNNNKLEAAARGIKIRID
jgi:hypothetical protein